MSVDNPDQITPIACKLWMISFVSGLEQVVQSLCITVLLKTRLGSHLTNSDFFLLAIVLREVKTNCNNSLSL